MSAEECGNWLDHAATCETCRAIANTLPDEPVDIPPPMIGRFLPTGEIGRGAMGVVYAADDPQLGRPIAIKVLHDSADGERLHREARSLAKLTHDNVVRVYDSGVDDGRVWVAMELVDGVTLRAWLRTPRSLDAIVTTLIAAGRGLSAVHAAGIVHRDFKPDNVLVGADRVVIGDFGLSRVGAHIATELPDDRLLDSDAETRLTRTGAVVGTPAYMAPEQVVGDATAASDQFAFCVTAWEAVFGVRPFRGATLRELRDASLQGFFTRPANRVIPRRIERALRRGLAGDPADRFPSVAELLAALSSQRRTRWYVGGAIVTAAVAGSVANAAIDRSPDPCLAAGNAIFDVWNDAARARVRGARGQAVAAAFEDYAQRWRTARVDACHRPADAMQRSAHDICYERARAELANQLASPPPLDELRSKLIPTETCDADIPLPKTPGYEVDVRGCGCPYSACNEARVCLSQCNARTFRPAGKVVGINHPHAQDAIVGATADGATLLYLSGELCKLDHLYLARQHGTGYTPVDLTPQLVRHNLVPFEGCCTISANGTSLIVAHRWRPGFVRFGLDGDTLIDANRDELTALERDMSASDLLNSPVLAPDELALYFSLNATASDTPNRTGPHVARRASRDVPFEAPTRLTGRVALYEYVTGISADNRTLFMATEFATSVLVRPDATVPFGDLGEGKPPSRLPGWRAIPIENCRRIITTMTPGGCRSEDTVFLEAIGP